MICILPSQVFVTCSCSLVPEVGYNKDIPIHSCSKVAASLTHKKRVIVFLAWNGHCTILEMANIHLSLCRVEHQSPNFKIISSMYLTLTLTFMCIGYGNMSTNYNDTIAPPTKLVHPLNK
jgi:hypothetical protein